MPDCSEAMERALVLQRAEQALVDAVDAMRRHYRINRTTAEMVADIEATMSAKVQPHGYTVLEAVSSRERDAATPALAAAQFPALIRDIEQEIKNFQQDRDVLQDRNRPSRARERRRIARSALSPEPGKYRRLRAELHRARKAKEPPDKEALLSATAGRPEVYDPHIVVAFRDAAVRATGREQFERGHREGGLMLAVLVAALTWATTVAWQASAPPGSRPPPTATREGVLRIIRGR